MPLRIIANENISGPVVSALRAAGHDVVHVTESMRVRPMRTFSALLNPRRGSS